MRKHIGQATPLRTTLQFAMNAMLYFVGVLLIGGAFASTIQDSNRFIDDFLTNQFSQEASRLQLISVPLEDFKFKIKKELELGLVPTHRDIKANFTNGILTGINQLKRRGDCNPTFFAQGNIVLTCPISLSSIEAKYTSFVKGFNIVGQVKEIPVSVKVTDSFINFAVQQETNKQAFIKTFQIEKLDTQVTFPDIGFNEERTEKFKKEVEKGVHPLMFNILTGRVLDAINSALKQNGVTLPAV